MSAFTALAAHSPAGQNLNPVENQVPTGLANSTAAGDPPYWPIAAKMSSDASPIGAVDDALSQSQPLASTMSAALNTTISLLDALKNDLGTASNLGADLNEIETDIAAQRQSVLATNITAATAGDFANMATDGETANGSILTAASTLGAATNKRTTPQTRVSNIGDSLTMGVGSLVAAKLHEAATKLAARRVQQQLGEQALSISKSNTKLILKLFELSSENGQRFASRTRFAMAGQARLLRLRIVSGVHDRGGR
ncbi:MAG: flagellin [Methylocella sp.]